MKALQSYFTLLLFLLLVNKTIYAQIGLLSHVSKLPLKFVYSIEDRTKTNSSTKKVDGHWIAFSDSEKNTTFSDRFGRKKHSALRFLEPVYVLKSRNGYCKVIAYDPSILAGPGLFGVLFGTGKEKYRVADRKKAVFRGWIKETMLLHSPNAFVGQSNLQPFKYLSAIHQPKSITSREQYLQGDSLLLNHAPGLRKEPKSKALLGDWMYIYKRLNKLGQCLVGTEPTINPDSSTGTFGWVAENMILPLNQNMVLLPDHAELANDEYSKSEYPVHWAQARQQDWEEDSSCIPLEKHIFPSKNSWMLPLQMQIRAKLDSLRHNMYTYLPTELIDIQNSSIYNCLGQQFSFAEFLDIRTKLKNINIMVVFEDGKEGKISLRNMITSFQSLSQQTHSSAMAGYKFNFAAVGYMARWVTDTLNWTNSFTDWLSFIQRRAEDLSVDLETYEHVMLRGIQEAAVLLKGKEHEHNIVIVIGSKINSETFPKLFDNVVPLLAAASANLLFLQPELGKSQHYSDFVLQAKRMLSEVGKASRTHRQRIIVDNNHVKYQNEFQFIDQCGNGFLYDFPERSMQKGGIFFPDANRSLCPNLLEWVIDSLFKQIRMDNAMLLTGMRDKFALLSQIEQNTNPVLKQNLEEQAIIGLPDKIINTYNDNFYVKAVAGYDPKKTSFKAAFLLREDEFLRFAENLRKVVIDPKVDRNGDSEIDFRDRKRWARELRRTFKERNTFFENKNAIGKVSLAQIIFMETGYPVGNPYFHDLPLKDVKRKAEQEDLLPAIQHFYRDILKMEAYPSEVQSSILNRGHHRYFILPVEILP